MNNNLLNAIALLVLLALCTVLFGAWLGVIGSVAWKVMEMMA
jgi:hypothetical protein